jgi:hypothetical protein
MNDQEIDEQELNRKKDQVRDETDPVGKRAGDEGGCDDGKHHLVRNEHDYWYIVIHRKDISHGDVPEKSHIEIADNSTDIPQKSRVSIQR